MIGKWFIQNYFKQKRSSDERIAIKKKKSRKYIEWLITQLARASRRHCGKVTGSTPVTSTKGSDKIRTFFSYVFSGLYYLFFHHLINIISVIVKILRTDYFVTTIQAVNQPKKRMIGKWFTRKYFKAKARQRREN